MKFPKTSLFHGISQERITRLRSITVGGRRLFDERGEVTEIPRSSGRESLPTTDALDVTTAVS